MINLIKNQKTVDKILLSLAVLCLVMILLLSVNAFYNGGDDYNFISDLNKFGVINNCIRGYFDWDGRLLTIGALVQGFCIKYLPIKIIVFLWSICFLFSGLSIYYILKNEINLSNLKEENRLLILMLLPIVLWLGSFKHLPETVYWATGGVYSFDLFVGAIWICGFIFLQKNKSTFASKIFFIIFSIIAGATTENLSIGLITLVLIEILINYFDNIKNNKNFQFLILFGLTAGLLFIVLAPGNFLRLHEIKKIENPNFTLIYFIKNLIKTVAHFIYWSSILCLLSVILGIAIAFLINPNINLKYKFIFYKFNTKQNWKTFLNETKWLWVTLSTITPFITIPEVVSVRTAIYFMFFIMIYITIFIINTIQKIFINNNENQIIRKNLYYQNTIILLILISTISFASYNLYKGTKLKKAITERELILKKGKNKITYLKLIDPKLNSTIYKYTDLINDGKVAQPWIKYGLEEFYSTKIIIVK